MNKRKTLYDLHKDTIDTILSEALNSSIEIKWVEKATNWVGTFATKNGKKYRIEILIYSEKVQKLLKLGNVYAFKYSRWNNELDDWDSTLSNEGDKSFMVFGALAKGLFEFIDSVHPDIILLIGDEHRKSMYTNLGYRAATVKCENYGFDDLQIGSDYVFILVNKTAISPETMNIIRVNVLEFELD